MTTSNEAGPYETLRTAEGIEFAYYIIPFDAAGVCEGPETRAHLIANCKNATDIFVFSHGWNNDFAAATGRYKSFIEGIETLRKEKALPVPEPYRPIVVGIFWPSQALEWFASETGPAFAGGEGDAAETKAFEAAAAGVAAALPQEQRARFHELAASQSLSRAQAEELARLLVSTVDDEAIDSEAGPVGAPRAEDLLASAQELEEPEPDYDGVGYAGDAGDAAPQGEPAAAAGGPIGKALGALDPRNILKPFTLWQMKDRAGRVGAHGVAPLLTDLLANNDTARIHLLGHSFGCKVVMTATSAMPSPSRQIESALLLQAAVSQYAFSPSVPGLNVPGGFVKALDRVRLPIFATYSSEDKALSEMFHLMVRRHDDAGELQYAGKSPSRYGALGGFGPQDTPAAGTMVMRDPTDPYDLPSGKRLVALMGDTRIHGHGDISNKATWWAEYCLLMGHQTLTAVTE